MALKPGAVAKSLSRESQVEAAWEQHEVEEVTGGDTPREGAAEEEVVEAPEGEEEQPPEGEEEQPPEGEEEVAEGEEEEQPPEGEEGDRNPDGTFKKKPALVEETPEQLAAAEAARAETSSKLNSWKPGDRQALLALKGPEGDAVRASVLRREAQFTAYQRETEQIRGFANDFVRRTEPYKGLYSMLQTTPLQAFDVLMRSAAVLYQGDPRMKAKAVADMIRERGIDPAIVADFLDGVGVDGKPVAQPDPQIQQLLDKVSGLETQLQSNAQRETETAQAQADRHVADWAKTKPWFNDVKRRMGVLMQTSEAEGVPLTLDQAYATAISLDPEISKLEKQRLAALNVQKKKQDAIKARRAASSPGSSHTVTPRGVQTSKDRTSAVEAAWEEEEGRLQ